MKKTRFADLSPRGKVGASAVIGVSLVIVAAAQRDIQLRSAEEIRGEKLAWRLVCLNALGAVAYFARGRRAPVS